MNEYDRNNLHFIMNLDTREFEDWAMESSDDEIQYAIEIIRQARLELAEQERELLEADLEDSGFNEANAVLKKFML